MAKSTVEGWILQTETYLMDVAIDVSSSHTRGFQKVSSYIFCRVAQRSSKILMGEV